MSYKLWRACKRGAIIGVLAAALCPSGTNAATLFYQFTNVFAGTAPEGSAPWVDATFKDLSTGSVQLTISAGGLNAGEFLNELFFNLNPSLNPSKLSFTYISSTGTFGLPTISKGANDFKADGQGKFDIEFLFSQKTAKAFDGTDTVVYDISSSASALKASDFDFLSTASGGCGQFLAAAEISGIPGSGCSPGDGWVAPVQVNPAPEPSSIAMLAAAAALFSTVRLFRNRTKQA